VLHVTPLEILQHQIVSCTACTRLVDHCTNVAQVKRRAYRDWTYWGKPVPSFGDPHARLLIVGLAPGAHGANRTGRVFTGDSSGDFLYAILHETGFASQPQSHSIEDGLRLHDAYIAASVRCAPPDNKPSRDEILRCRTYLERELPLLPQLRVVVALGKLAFDNYLDIQRAKGLIKSRAPFQFAHGAVHRIGPGEPILLASYHPSQQNTSTGKLTVEMFRKVFLLARRLLEAQVS
jgi:uracil-DNA glycosylase